MNSEKVNFRGHQKALMRIMDGTSKRKEDEPEKKRRQLDMKAREEELRRYEE